MRKELEIFTFKDLLEHYPLRHVDRTSITSIASLSIASDYAQVAGTLISIEMVGEKRARRLVAHLKDNTGILELVWFQGIAWAEKLLQVGQQYLVFGKTGFFMGTPQMAHPDIEHYHTQQATGKAFLEPVYPSTEKLKAKGLHGKAIGKLTQELFKKITDRDLPENLPSALIRQFRLMDRFEAFKQIHLPVSEENYQKALRRLKFEELFFAQFSIQLIKLNRQRSSRGQIFEKVGDLFNGFYNNHLPFELTNA